MMEDLKNIIESMLFVSEDPLTIDRIKNVLTFADTKEIRNALKVLLDEYESRKGGFFLHEVAGGYQIRTRPEYTEWIKRLVKPNPRRISKAALETLAIIAYKQPVIRSDIEHIRGVDCGGVIRMLLERKLVRVLGRKKIPGRPLIYATTKQFLETFDLKDLKDLPTPKEIEELTNSLSEKKEETSLDSLENPENSLNKTLDVRSTT
jgi:segregation and condensation protein B